jgi:serine/threonine/tyrosine protein kinase RAD53
MLDVCTAHNERIGRTSPFDHYETVRGSSDRDIQRLSEPFWSRFAVVSVIHDGGEQCRVFKVSTSDNKEYVAKIQAKQKVRGATESTFRIMMKRLLNLPGHSTVVHVHSCFEDDKHFYTLYESLKGGDLWDYFDSTLSRDCWKPEQIEDAAVEIVRSILTSLKHLHSQGLLHNDVKLENLVFKEASPKSSKSPTHGSGVALIDFDFLKTWEPSSPKNKYVLGTDGYIAPESYLGDASPKSDVFSAGVVMYILIAGCFPYRNDTWDDKPGQNVVGSFSMMSIYQKMKARPIRFGGIWGKLPQARDLCQRLLAFDADDRCDAGEALKHPWFSGK